MGRSKRPLSLEECISLLKYCDKYIQYSTMIVIFSDGSGRVANSLNEHKILFEFSKLDQLKEWLSIWRKDE